MTLTELNALAREMGLPRWRAPVACPTHGTYERRTNTSTGLCIECDNERRRKWYAENRERAVDGVRLWQARNDERYRELKRRWIEGNRERERERLRRWDRDNRERRGMITRRWQAANPDAVRAVRHRRRARKHNTIAPLTTPELRALDARTFVPVDEHGAGLCPVCFAELTRSTAHLDHDVPLSRGGAHSLDNVAYVCGPCNLAKNTRTMQEFRIEQARRDFAEGVT